MWKKATIGGLAAAAIVGTAGFAVAQSTSTTPSAATAAGISDTPSPSASAGATSGASAKAKGDKAGDRALGRQLLGKLKDFEHAEWVTKGGANTTVTHDAILGSVTAVNGTSITVKADGGTSLTFAMNADTKIRQRAKGHGADGSIGDLEVGQVVLVSGKKSPGLTATLVLSRA